jgi:hypothetical protein
MKVNKKNFRQQKGTRHLDGHDLGSLHNPPDTHPAHFRPHHVPRAHANGSRFPPIARSRLPLILHQS